MSTQAGRRAPQHLPAPTAGLEMRLPPTSTVAGAMRCLSRSHLWSVCKPLCCSRLHVQKAAAAKTGLVCRISWH
jgi:hypothetical protein